MQTGQLYDDAEAVIMAADENPEYREQIVDGFLDQALRRRNRRVHVWRITVALLAAGISGTILIDRLISFPLSLFAFIFLWAAIIVIWGALTILTMLKRHVTRLALMWLLMRIAAQRDLSRRGFSLLTLSLLKTSLTRLINRYIL
jgi:hypothetical protein